MSGGNLHSLRDAIGRSLAEARPQPRFEEARNVLRAAADAIQQADVLPDDAEVHLEPGYAVRAGQQVNVVLNIPSRRFRDTLFRAYLPAEGFPVSLDLFGEDLLVCPDAAELQRQIVAFVNEHVRTRLAMLAV